MLAKKQRIQKKVTKKKPNSAPKTKFFKVVGKKSHKAQPKNKKYKKPRQKKKLTTNQLLVRLQLSKNSRPPALPLNTDFYRNVEGVYNSY